MLLQYLGAGYRPGIDPVDVPGLASGGIAGRSYGGLTRADGNDGPMDSRKRCLRFARSGVITIIIRTAEAAAVAGGEGQYTAPHHTTLSNAFFFSALYLVLAILIEAGRSQESHPGTN